MTTRTSGALLDWAGVVLLTACAALLAALEVFLVSLYVGSVIAPVSVLLAIVGNLVLPRLAFGLTATLTAAAAPFVTWLAVLFTFGLVPRPEGDVIVPGVGGAQYVYLGALVGGIIAGTATLVICATPSVAAAARAREERISR